MFKRFELSLPALFELRKHCDELGLIFFSTPTSEQGVVDLVEMGVKLLKNGSDFLGHLPLIHLMAETGLPTVLSTGMATLADIDEAVRTFQEAGGTEMILLVCTSTYPAPPTDVHLRRLTSMAGAFGCPVGFSDHTDGIEAALGAVALGACFVEKHFTLDKKMFGPDHLFSSDPGEFVSLVDGIRRMEKYLGDAVIGPKTSEQVGRKDFRLSCAVATDLPAGHVLARRDIAFKRPGRGVPPKEAYLLEGRRLRNSLVTGEIINISDLG